ncbi:MAG: hypothetical protein JWO38_7299 [Gemmataceae bacterium]|nr:hypothetical protein [Gemmataceae bacterium]
MPPPPRSSGTTPFPLTRNPTGAHSVPVYEIVKARILIKLQERVDASKARRMPASLLQESTRQQIEPVVEAEAHRLTRAERDRLIEEVYEELFGFGPLEELFADPGVMEITVLGPHAVIARRDQGWFPTNVKFQDDDHLHEVLQKVQAQGEPVGGALPASVLDVKLSNGFRAVAIVPPSALGRAPTAAFVRAAETGTRPPTPGVSTGTGSHPVVTIGGPGTPAPTGGTGTHTALPPQVDGTGSARVAVPSPQSGVLRSPAPGECPLERHRVRITARLIAKLSGLGVYDLSRVDTHELKRVVAAYVTEYCQVEKVYLSDTDQGRLMLEILTGMNR